MAHNSSHVELSIELDTEDDEQKIKHLLSTLPLENVVLQTLSQAAIERPVVVALLITNDATIQSLNKRYRNQDKSTDVLSFPLLEKPVVHAPMDQLWMKAELLEGVEFPTQQIFITPPDITTHLGDIVISWPMVQRQSSEVGHDPAYELLFLISHGVLHLIGYDDQTQTGYQAMIRIQQSVLDAIGLKM